MITYDLEKTAEYYDQIAGTYDEVDLKNAKSSDYPANHYRFELVKAIFERIPPGRILDAGCGTGKVLAWLITKGHDCAGTDISAGMLEGAKRNIGAVSPKMIPLIQTPLDNLSMFEDRSFDHVFCLGVLPYIPEEQEEGCYRELRRVIKPKGLFITAHQNEIFDTFTFNRHTLRFFEQNLYPLLAKASPHLGLESCTKRLSSLLSSLSDVNNPDPKRSGRNRIFTRPENPIVYPEKLARYGFQHQEMLYYHFHALPPLLRNSDPEMVELSKALEIVNARQWQGMFMASTFVNVAKAV